MTDKMYMEILKMGLQIFLLIGLPAFTFVMILYITALMPLFFGLFILICAGSLLAAYIYHMLKYFGVE